MCLNSSLQGTHPQFPSHVTRIVSHCLLSCPTSQPHRAFLVCRLEWFRVSSFSRSSSACTWTTWQHMPRLHCSQNRHNTTVWTDSRQVNRYQTLYCLFQRHRFCLVSLCLSISECWDGSQHSKLLLHASHAAHQDQIKTPQIYVCYVWYVCNAATGRQSNCSK